jgi:hypothetical protein
VKEGELATASECLLTQKMCVGYKRQHQFKIKTKHWDFICQKRKKSREMRENGAPTSLSLRSPLYYYCKLFSCNRTHQISFLKSTCAWTRRRFDWAPTETWTMSSWFFGFFLLKWRFEINAWCLVVMEDGQSCQAPFTFFLMGHDQWESSYLILYICYYFPPMKRHVNRTPWLPALFVWVDFR